VVFEGEIEREENYFLKIKNVITEIRTTIIDTKVNSVGKTKFPIISESIEFNSKNEPKPKDTKIKIVTIVAPSFFGL